MTAPVENVRKTLYDLLGTQPEATREEIEQAYRAAVVPLQPDIDAGRPDALNQQRLLREAYHILADDARRARYDARMKLLGGTEKVTAARQPGIDGVGWTIIVALVALAIGAVLTVFMLLEHAEDVRTEYAESVRQKKAEQQKPTQIRVVPLPAVPATPGREPRP
jgi:DnaJ-class molecular chaperone